MRQEERVVQQQWELCGNGNDGWFDNEHNGSGNYDDLGDDDIHIK